MLSSIVPVLILCRHAQVFTFRRTEHACLILQVWLVCAYKMQMSTASTLCGFSQELIFIGTEHAQLCSLFRFVHNAQFYCLNTFLACPSIHLL